MNHKKSLTRLFSSFAVAWLAVSLVLGRSLPAAAKEGQLPNSQKPNIVFIFADDLGWTDLACFGSKYYETPNIDQLRSQGMKFSSAYTNAPNCAPTRACLMSGQYSPRHGIYTVGSGARGKEKFRKMKPVKNITQLPLDITTMADALKAAGYRTGMFGKWHLGNRGGRHPSRRGFDEAIVTSGRHFSPRFNTNPKVEVPEGEYLADFLTDQAVRFIEKNQKRPFFLYLPHFAVHTPIEAKEDAIAKFKDKQPLGGHHNPVYAGMIDAIDESVGRVTAKLDELNLTKNTIVIFYSDNGGHGGYAELGGSTGRNITNNAPLRGGKGMLYEGGVRVPLIVRWPGKVEAGAVCHDPVIGLDFYSTFLDISGGKSDPKHTLDGVSFLPLLTGKGSLKREALYWHFPGYLEANAQLGTWRTTPGGAIRVGDYKLIEFFENGRLELYNLREDLSQKNDLAEAMPEMTKKLHAKLVAWRKAVQAPMPTLK